MAFRGLLLDLEGVLYQGEAPLPGAAEPSSGWPPASPRGDAQVPDTSRG